MKAIIWGKAVHSKNVTARIKEIEDSKPTQGKYYYKEIDETLKSRLDEALQRYISEGKSTSLSHLLSDICSTNNFYKNILSNKERVIYLFSLDDKSQDSIKEFKERTLEELVDILNMPIIKKNGKINYSLANYKVKVFKTLFQSK